MTDATERLQRPERPERERARWRGPLVSTVALVCTVVFGEAGLIAVVGAGRHLAGGANLAAWFLATVVNAVAGFYLFGLTQLRAWAPGAMSMSMSMSMSIASRRPDARSRLAARSLSTGGMAGFVTASVVGGPLAVGWFYARRGDPRARSLTWTAAWLLAAVWSAVYLGLLTAL
jgi:hypothetical protein